MSKYRDLGSGDVFPAYWTDAIQEFTGTLVAGLRLSLAGANIVRASASTGSGQVAIGVDGLFRYRSSNADVTVTGTTGTYGIYVAVGANDITGITDSTDYNWYLYASVSAPTGTLPGGAAIAATRKVGEVDWDNAASAITALRQTAAAGDVTLPSAPAAPAATVTPLAVRGATSQSANLVTVGSSASASDRMALSAAGRLALPVTGSSGGLVIGGDANLYRTSANTLATDGGLAVSGAVNGDTVSAAGELSGDSLTVNSDATVGGAVTADSGSFSGSVSATTVTTSGNATVGGSVSLVSLSTSQNNKTALALSGTGAGMTLGGDTTLYRSGASNLKTDGALEVSGSVSVGGNVGFYGTTPVARSTGWSVTNVTTDKAFNADSTTVDELADVLGTLINTLKANGLIA